MVSERVKQHLAEFEDRACTCGAGHGSLEGHTDWCDWSEYLSAAARVRAEANNECGEAAHPAPQPSGTVGALVKALIKALEPFAKHGNASCDYVEISSKHLRAAHRSYLDACEVLWCETCGERPQEVRTEHAGLCRECWISEGRPE